MRALFGNVRMNVASILQNPFSVFFSILLMPLLLVALQATLSSSLVTPTVVDMNLPFYVEDQDGSEESKAFMNLLFSDSFKGIISEVDEKEKAEYLLALPKGFGEKIKSDENYSLDLEVRRDEAGSSSYFLKDIVQRTLLNFRRERWKASGGEKLIQSIYEKTPVKDVTVKTMELDTVLQSKAYFGVIGIQLVYLVFLVTQAMGDQQLTKTTDVLSRVYVAPQKKTTLQHHTSLSNFLVLALMSTLFMIIVRLSIHAFSGSLPLQLAVNLVVCLVVIGFGSLLFSIFPPGSAVYITNAILIFQVIFGGASGVDFGLGKLGEFFEKFTLHSLYVQPYVDISRGDVRAAFMSLLPFIFVGLFSYLLSLVVVSRKKVI